MFGSSWETLLNIWSAFPDVRECREDLPNVRKWSGDPLGCLGVDRRPSLIFGSG